MFKVFEFLSITATTFFLCVVLQLCEQAHKTYSRSFIIISIPSYKRTNMCRRRLRAPLNNSNMRVHSRPSRVCVCLCVLFRIKFNCLFVRAARINWTTFHRGVAACRANVATQNTHKSVHTTEPDTQTHTYSKLENTWVAHTARCGHHRSSGNTGFWHYKMWITLATSTRTHAMCRRRCMPLLSPFLWLVFEFLWTRNCARSVKYAQIWR